MNCKHNTVINRHTGTIVIAIHKQFSQSNNLPTMENGDVLSLGLAVGARGEDYQAADVDPRGRGRRFAEQLEAIRDIWEAGRIGPKPAGSGPQR